jgi:hypothetical protein
VNCIPASISSRDDEQLITNDPAEKTNTIYLISPDFLKKAASLLCPKNDSQSPLPIFACYNNEKDESYGI